MQTVFILMFIFIILIAAFFFYLKMQFSSANEKSIEYRELDAISRNSMINELPELACVHQGVIIRDCFDTEKIKQFKKQVSESKSYYSTAFKTMKLVIKRFNSPASPDDIIYENKKEDSEIKETITSPVILYDPVLAVKDEGVIIVETYS